jgi:diguanylate cyclase (GGDEF)-like protein
MPETANPAPGTDPRPLVLLVDDEPANLQVLVEALRQPYRIKIARDGQSALALVLDMARRGQPPDLVVLDVLMPGMDGFSVCREIKNNPLTRTLPVVFVTLVADSCVELERMQFEAVDYIIKPVNPAALRLRLANLVQLKRLRDRLDELSTHDPLTGLANRPRFDAFLADEWRRAQRSGAALSLLRLDVDHFRHYNELYNSLNGDAALQRIAAVLQSHQRRPGDLAARLGSDDFALVLAGTDAVGALAVAESVRRGIEGLLILHADVPGRAATPGVLTARIGVGVERAPSELSGIPLLLLQAEEQLDRARQAGGNQVASQALR